MKILRLLAALIAVCLPALAMTQIQDIQYSSNGVLAQGRIVISNPAFTTSEGVSVTATVQTYILINGVLSLSLEPNMGSTPSPTAYTATYYLAGGATYTETWVVPDTPSQVQSHNAIRTTSSQTVFLGQLSGTGASIGNCP